VGWFGGGQEKCEVRSELRVKLHTEESGEKIMGKNQKNAFN